MARESEFEAHSAFKANVLEVKLQNAQSIIEAQQDRIKELIDARGNDFNTVFSMGLACGVIITAIAAAVLL